MAYYAFVFKGDADDRHLYEMHVMSEGMWHVLWDYDNWLRSRIKYANEEVPEVVVQTHQEARDELHALMDNHEVNLDRVD